MKTARWACLKICLLQTQQSKTASSSLAMPQLAPSHRTMTSITVHKIKKNVHQVWGNKICWKHGALTGVRAALNLGWWRMRVRLLAAPRSIPARQPERLQSKAEVCDIRRAPGYGDVLGAGYAATVGKKHPPAAHSSQLRLFRSEIQLANKRRKKP